MTHITRVKSIFSEEGSEDRNCYSLFIRRNTRTSAYIAGLEREETTEYPMVALREVLVNAIAHADYELIGMTVRLAIFDDRLEVETPGGWPIGITEEDMKAGVSRIRNPVIARVLHELRLMERWGSGYRRIRESCESGGYLLPTWHEVGSVLRTRFMPHPEVQKDSSASDVPVNERQEWFLKQIYQGARLTTNDLASQFGVTRKTAQRDIAKLREAGVIQFTGAPKTGHYEIVSSGTLGK